jgi:predicted nucleic acid-binding protein
VSAIVVSDFGQCDAETAARLAAELKLETIGLADFQIAACALEDNAELLTFSREHFGRVPGLHLASV